MDRSIDKGKSTLKFLGVLYALYEVYTLLYMSYWFDIDSIVFPVIYSIGRMIILVGILSLMSMGKKWARIVYQLIWVLALFSVIEGSAQFNFDIYTFLSTIVILVNILLVSSRNVTAYMGRVENY